MQLALSALRQPTTFLAFHLRRTNMESADVATPTTASSPKPRGRYCELLTPSTHTHTEIGKFCLPNRTSRSVDFLRDTQPYQLHEKTKTTLSASQNAPCPLLWEGHTDLAPTSPTEPRNESRNRTGPCSLSNTSHCAIPYTSIISKQVPETPTTIIPTAPILDFAHNSITAKQSRSGLMPELPPASPLP